MTSEQGAALYDVVRDYDALEHHRTGTANDEQTQRWLADLLAAHGATVHETSYEFDQFTVNEHRVTIDGDVVESIPLWYAGTGRHDTADLRRFAWPFTGGNHGTHDSWADLVTDQRPSVAATTGIGDMLGVPNRAPRFSLSQPVLLIAGSWADQLDAADLRIVADTKRSPGRSTTVFGRFGPVSSSPIVVTTPMTGWFRCAGERGTGIAIAIELAAELGRERSVLFVGTTGHEIGYLGVDRLVSEGGFGSPSAVVHVGASAAAGTVEGGDGMLSSNRMVLSSLPPERGARLIEAAESGGLRVVHDPPDWFGEGEMLKRLGAPLLSFVGSFENFHTPLDTIARVTSPTMLSAASDTIGRTVRAFLAASDG